MKDLEDILKLIKRRNILSDRCFSGKDLDGILEQRDEDPFDNDWITSYNNIDEMWSNFQAPDEIIDLIEEIRKESFLTTSRATQQHEIASYVSEDFDLISKNIVLKVSDSFVESLLFIYMADSLPKDE